MDNIGFYKFNKNKIFKKLHISIDSRERDKKIYPDPNNYKINLNNDGKIKYVNSIRLLEAFIPHSEYTFNDNNNKIEVMDDTGNIKIYTIKKQYINFIDIENDLPNVINNSKSELDEPLSDIINCKYIIDTEKVTLTSSKSDRTYTLLFETGNCFNKSPIDILGFDKKDYLVSYHDLVGEYIVNIHHTNYVDLVIDEIPKISNKLMIKKNLNTYVFKRIPMIANYGEHNHYFAPEDSTYNYFNPIEFSMFSIQFFNDKGLQYNTNGDNNYLIFELTMLTDESSENINFLSSSLKPLDNNIINSNSINIIESNKLTDKSTNINNINNIENSVIEEYTIQEPDIEENVKSNIEIFENKEKDIYDELKDLFIENKITIISIIGFIIIFLFIFSRKK